MICELHIQNFALIKNQTICFGENFNVLMGETGAGKSLILKALDFVLGAKADKQNIRIGELSTTVEATFFCQDEGFLNELSQCGFDPDANVQITRTLFANGRCDQKINGRISSVAQLRQLSPYLVTSFAQHDNNLLLDQSLHIKLLDEFCGEDVDVKKQEIAHLLHKVQSISSEMKSIGGMTAERENKLELLRYQIDEISTANLLDNEDEILKEKMMRFSASEKVRESIGEVLGMLSGSNTVSQTLHVCARALQAISKYDDDFAKHADTLQSFGYDVCEVCNTLKEKQDEFLIDAKELEEIDQRLDLINTLKRKYGPTLYDVSAFLADATNEYDFMLKNQLRFSQLETELSSVRKQLFVQSQNLSDLRRKHAAQLKQKLISELADLNMKNSRFDVQFAPQPERVEDCAFDADGFDKVCFMFSANVGVNQKNLSKTISGGEMSRFMLALKNVVGSGSYSTFVFDEIDSGISGWAATSVAKKMATIATKNQIICISHLPQVCSLADHFIYVEKAVEDEQTISRSKMLDNADVSVAISTMTSGLSDSHISNELAQEMLQTAKTFKQTLHVE